MLGIRTQGGRIVGADEFTELWRHPSWASFDSNIWSHLLWQTLTFFHFLRPTARDRNRKENNSDKSLSFWEMADPRILYLKCLKRHLFCVHWQMTFSEVNFFTQKDWRLRPVRKYLNPMFFMNENFLFFQQDKYITNLTTNDKSIHGLVGIRTMGGRMVSKDESIELWRHPLSPLFFFVFFVGWAI